MQNEHLGATWKLGVAIQMDIVDTCSCDRRKSFVEKVLQGVKGVATRMTLFLAQYINANNYDSGAQMNTLLLGFYQLEWLVCLMVGVQLFIAFSGRFKP